VGAHRDPGYHRYFDTGYIQNLDFFDNGPRIPFMVVSPYARPDFIDYTHYDHSPMLKFIERNWRLSASLLRQPAEHSVLPLISTGR
jgi:phospholipase C